MFKLFRKSENNAVLEAEPKAVLKGKTTSQIIQEIHDTFYTEVERISEEASKTNSLETDKQELIDKCKRLEAIGFSNSQEVKEARQEITRIATLQAENQKRAELLEAVKYFSFTYPHYKFITEDSVKKICEKYNLIYSTIDKYIGTVPDRNLKHIEDFKIKEEDECYEKRLMWRSTFGGGSVHSAFMDIKRIKEFKKDQQSAEPHDWRGFRQFIGGGEYSVEKLPLEICAPIKDFDTKVMEVKDFKLSKIEIPDPVVLKPVFFKGKKHFLVVTAWGIEASDELVANPIHN